MTTYTVFYKAQIADGSRFLSSTSISAQSKEDAAQRVLASFKHAKEVTSVMVGR